LELQLSIPSSRILGFFSCHVFHLKYLSIPSSRIQENQYVGRQKGGGYSFNSFKPDSNILNLRRGIVTRQAFNSFKPDSLRFNYYNFAFFIKLSIPSSRILYFRV